MVWNVNCPYCKTDFTAPDGSLRATCPRCLETVDVQAHHRPPVSEPVGVSVGGGSAEAVTSGRSYRYLMPGVLAGSIAALLAGYFLTNKPRPQPSPTPPIVEHAPPATRPPLMLRGVKQLPAGVNIVLAFQPSPLLQYAQRVGKDPRKLIEDAGLPAALLDIQSVFGVALVDVDHLVLGLSLGEKLPPAAALVLQLRQMNLQDTDLKKRLKAREIEGQRGRYQVELPGFPDLLNTMTMTVQDNQTYLLATTEAELTEMAGRKPEGPAQFLKPGLREALSVLSPASFIGLATDDTDWSKNRVLELLAKIRKEEETLKKLDGLRSAAVGLSIEPDLELRLALRSHDAAAAAKLAQASQDRLPVKRTESSTDQAWAIWKVPFESPQNMLRLVRSLLEAR